MLWSGAYSLDQGVALSKVLPERRRRCTRSVVDYTIQLTGLQYLCDVGGGCLNLPLLSRPVRETGENVFRVEFVKDSDWRHNKMLHCPSARMSSVAIDILLACVPASISSTWSAASTLCASVID